MNLRGCTRKDFDVKVITPISQQAWAAVELLETNENYRYYNQDLGIIRDKEQCK